MRRWHVEIGLSGLFLLLTALTAVAPDWIELVFRVEPDAGSGSLEWALVAVFGLASVLTALLGRRSYKAAVDSA